MNWIDIYDKFPNLNEVVLISDEINKFVSIGMLIKEDLSIDLEDDKNDTSFKIMYLEEMTTDYFVTHWMPLPESPKD